MNIKVKFPNGHSLDFCSPTNWTSDQILHFAAINQSFYDQEKLSIYFAGKLLKGNEKLQDLIKNNAVANLNIQPTFLITIDRNKQEDPSSLKQQIYAEYMRNMKILSGNQHYKSNFVPLLTNTAMNFKFQQPVQDIEKKKPSARILDNRDSPEQKQIFFHCKMIIHLVLFYSFFFAYYQGYEVLILILTACYYWVKYQEFSAELKRFQLANERQQQQQQGEQILPQQQQEQQADQLEENQSQPKQQEQQSQQQQQQQQQQYYQKGQKPQVSQTSNEEQEKEKQFHNVELEDDQESESSIEDNKEYEAFAENKEQLSDFLKRSSQFQGQQFSAEKLQSQDQEIEFQENPEKVNQIQNEQEQEEIKQENSNLELLRPKPRRIDPSYILKAAVELIYCYIMSIIPSWHVGLYQQE